MESLLYRDRSRIVVGPELVKLELRGAKITRFSKQTQQIVET